MATVMYVPGGQSGLELSWGQRRQPPLVVKDGVINPYLIAFASIYLVWSYVHLASSIWVRAAFACFLIIRMKPDIIVPMMLSCLQLRLAVLAPGMLEGQVPGSGLEDVYESLTGYEAYAFTVPAVLMPVRAFYAAITGGANGKRFPWPLYVVWSIVSVLVIAGALYTQETGRGWTTGLRTYSMVSCCFYGMLMPVIAPREFEKLAYAFSVISIPVFIAGVNKLLYTRLCFVLAPVAASLSVILLRRRVSVILSLCVLITSASFCISIDNVTSAGTFTTACVWIWSVLMALTVSDTSRRNSKPFIRADYAIVVTAVVVFGLLIAGINAKVPEKVAYTESLLQRFSVKLFADRGPIWAASWKFAVDEGTWLSMPNRPFVVEQLGRQTLWRYGTHNLPLDLLVNLGWIAGSVSILVLSYVCLRAAQILTKTKEIGVQVFAIATLAGIVVGGLTVQYVIVDRQGEIVLIVAGLLIASQSPRVREEQTVQSTESPRFIEGPIA
jgi:hypothetical protein